MIEFDCEEVKRQLNRLAEAMPQDEVGLWLCTNKGSLVEYTCYAQSREGFEVVCNTNPDIAKCVTEFLAKAGPRTGRAAITKKREAIEEARLKLQQLESELDPLVSAIDKAESENPT